MEQLPTDQKIQNETHHTTNIGNDQTTGDHTEYSALAMKPQTAQVATTMTPSENPKLSIIAIFGLIFSLLFAPAGLVLSIIGIKQTGKGEGKKSGRLLSVLGTIISIIVLVSVLIITVLWSYFFNEANKTSTPEVDYNSTSTETTHTNIPVVYTDSVNGYKFEPGEGLLAANPPYLFSGVSSETKSFTLIASVDKYSPTSISTNIKRILQDSKMKSYAGADPEETLLTNSKVLNAYKINYTFTTSSGEKSEVWQLGFYAKESSSVVVLSIIQPYLDSSTSAKFSEYSQKVFRSVELL